MNHQCYSKSEVILSQFNNQSTESPKNGWFEKNLLLLFPGLLFYILVLIWNQYIVVFSIGNRLRDNIEPELLKGPGLKGWEHYRHEKLSEKWIHLLALPYFFFPQIFLGLIALYPITLTEHSIYYLKGHLVVIWLLYASIMLLVGLFLYLFNKNQLKNNPGSISKGEGR